MILGRALALFALLITVCLASPTRADTIVVKNPDGSNMELINVDVAEYRNIIGRGTFFITTGPGAPPSEATTSRVRSVDFGGGKPAELIVGDAPPGQRFAATLHRYEGGQLIASPEGSTDRFQVPIEKVLSFRGTGGGMAFSAPDAAPAAAGFGAPPAAPAGSGDPFGAPPAAAPAGAGDPFGAPPAAAPTGTGDPFGAPPAAPAAGALPPATDDFFASAPAADPAAAPSSDPFGSAPPAAAPDANAFPSGEDPGAADMADGSAGDEELDLDSNFGASSSPFGGSSAPSGAMLVLVMIASLILVALFLTTWIWMMVNAFMSGKIGWGVALIFLCWCFLTKIFYLKHYEGRYKGALSTMVIIEIVLNLVLNLYTRFGM